MRPYSPSPFRRNRPAIEAYFLSIELGRIAQAEGVAEPSFCNYAGFDRIRAGDLRLICLFRNEKLVIFRVRVMNRREAYR